MSDIVELHPKDDKDQIWICACGCQSHFVYADGRICCTCCGEGPSDGIFVKMDDVIGPLGKPLDKRHVVFTSDEERDFSFRRFAQRVLEPEVIVAAIFWQDGTVSFVGEVPENDARKKWFWRRMADLGHILGLEEAP